MKVDQPMAARLIIRRPVSSVVVCCHLLSSVVVVVISLFIPLFSITFHDMY